MVLWGVPGVGKSTFARWLKANKGYEHVDTDVVAARGPSSTLERSWFGVTSGQSTPEAFIKAAAEFPRPVVVEYGLFADPAGVALLSRLEVLGARPLWFDGDRAAAKEAWRSENRVGHRPFADGKWDEVVTVIDANWPLIQGFFGPDRIVRSIESGPAHVSPESTYASKFGDGGPKS